MSELLRVLGDDVDDETLRAAADAAYAALEARGVDVEGVAPVLHEQAADAGQQAIDDAVTVSDEPATTLILSAANDRTRRLRIRPHPDPGVAGVLREDHRTDDDWQSVGVEQLDRVEIDGDAWHGTDGVAECYRGP